MALWICGKCLKENFASVDVCQCGHQRFSSNSGGSSITNVRTQRRGITSAKFVAINLEVIAWLLLPLGLISACAVWYDHTHLNTGWGEQVYDSRLFWEGVRSGGATLLGFWIAIILCGALSSIVRGTNNV